MTEDILAIIVKSELNEKENFTEWFEDFFLREDISQRCTIEEFAIFFLNFIRNQTERFVRGNASSSCDTPRKRLASISESKSLILPSSSSSSPSTAIATSTSTESNNKQIDSKCKTSNISADSLKTRSFPSIVTALHKKFPELNTQSTSNEPKEKSIVKKSMSLSAINDSNNSKNTTANTPNLFKESQKCNSKIAERFNLSKETDNHGDDIICDDNSICNFSSDSLFETKLNIKRKQQHQKTTLLTKKHSNFENSLDFNTIKLTGNTTGLNNINLSESGSHEFPSLNKSFKTNSSTPMRKVHHNKSGCSERNTNNNSNTMNFSTTSNVGNSGNSGRNSRSSRNSNTSTPIGVSGSGDYFSRSHSSPICLGDFLSTPTSSLSQGNKQKSHNKRNHKDSNRSTSSNNNSNKNHSNSQNQSQQDIQHKEKSKPRRVLPTPISNMNSSFTNVESSFTSPAYRINVGNIMDISKEEILDKNNCIIQKERAQLKSQMHVIAKEFANELNIDNPDSHKINRYRIQSITENINDYNLKQDFQNLPETAQQGHQNNNDKIINPTDLIYVTPTKNFNSKINTAITQKCSLIGIEQNHELIFTIKNEFNKLANKLILNRFIEIHSALIELNLVTNILNEFTYLINIFNIDLQEFINFLEPTANTSVVPSIVETSSLYAKSISITTDTNDPTTPIKTTNIENLFLNPIELNEENKNEFNSIVSNNKYNIIEESLSNKLNDDTTNIINNKNIDNIISNKMKNSIESNINIKYSTTPTNCIDPKLINQSIDINFEFDIILKKFINCLYYALGVLKDQKNFLALLDTTSLKVILDNDLLKMLDDELKEFLNQIYLIKLDIENTKPHLEFSSKIDSCGSGKFQNVSYQPDSDTRNNFTSAKECEAFKKQRDLFYIILRTWEAKHLSHNWNFELYLGPKIQTLLTLSENPINMSHLAKLFISQLILSLNFFESPTDLDIGLSNIDINKLTKLRQRLVAPSHFSQDYQFPGNQQFFKDFLIISQSVVFIEQLKIILINELLELNDSTYETIDLISKTSTKCCNNFENSNDNNSNDNIKNNDDINNCNNEIIILNEEQSKGKQQLENSSNQQQYHEYVVRPEIISTMRVLGKFLGLLISRPYRYDGNRNSLIENKQIELRNMLRPEFDCIEILKKSINNRRLIITLPWIIEYLSMLDDITLKLDYYRKMMNYLYELYMKLKFNKYYSNENYYQNTKIIENSENSINILNLQNIRPTSIFILRTCLGWLFEQFNIVEDYYIYRQSVNINKNRITKKEHKEKHQSEFESVAVINDNELLLKCNNLIKMKSIERDFKDFRIQQEHELFNKINNENVNVDNDNNNDNEKSNTSLIFNSSTIDTVNISAKYSDIYIKKISNIQKIKNSFDPLLENILNVSCPFLADFRVSIMPPKLSKSVSRSGRLRHITTKLLPDTKISTQQLTALNKLKTISKTSVAVTATGTDITTNTTLVQPISSFTSNYHQLNKNSKLFFESNVDVVYNADRCSGVGSGGVNGGCSAGINEILNLKIEKYSQAKLIEAFLHSQSLSVRRIVEFVIERTTSAVIKDFQMEILLKSKTEANLIIEKISSSDLKMVKNEMTIIYTNAHQNVMIKWDLLMSNMIKIRVEKALDALLPNETLPIIKSTCASIIIQKCKLKTEIWRQTNLTIHNFYSKDVNLDAEKFVKNFTTKKTEHSTNLELDLKDNLPPPSEVLGKLQFWLHASNRRSEFVNESEIIKLFDDLELTLNSHVLPTTFYRLCGIATTILLQNLVIKHSQILTDSLIQKFVDIWYNDKMQEFSIIKENLNNTKTNMVVGDSEESEISISENSKQFENGNKFNMFNLFFAECFLKPLCGSNSMDIIKKFCQITVTIIVNKLLTISFVNNKFVSLFKLEWSPVEYKNLKIILEHVSSNGQIKDITNDNDDNKSSLFMEMLSDLLRDIDDY